MLAVLVKAWTGKGVANLFILNWINTTKNILMNLTPSSKDTAQQKP
jgi:hypothetical protein